MQIVRDLAGYSLGRSDLMRRAMAKKKKDVMAQEREYFVHGLKDDTGKQIVDGAINRGVDEKAAEEIFDEMSAFASYAFNKSHAAAYGVVAAQTAWLKLYHPVPFMAAMLNSVMDNTGKVSGYLAYCKAHGIPMLPPSVNSSYWKFSVDRDEKGTQGIRFGMGGVKNVGHSAVEAIVQARDDGKFIDLFDFLDRVPPESLNKRMLESLIKSGALDGMGMNRAQLLAIYDKAADAAALQQKQRATGQMSLFDMMTVGGGSKATLPIPDMPEHTKRALLSMEKEITGVYISGHPLDEYRTLLQTGYTTVSDVIAMTEGEDGGLSYDATPVTMGGIIVLSKGKITKKGSMMGFITLEDLTGQIEGLVFPKVYERYISLLQTDALVQLTGKLSFREEEEPKLLVDTVTELRHAATKETIAPAQPKPEPKAPQKKPSNPEMQAISDVQLAKASEQKLYVLLQTRSMMPKARETLLAHPGDIPVYLKLKDEGITLLSSRELWCDGTLKLLEALKKDYGEQAVVLKSQLSKQS